MHRYFESRLQRALAMYALVPLFVLTLLGTILLVASWRYSVVGVNDEIREQAAERLATVSDDFPAMRQPRRFSSAKGGIYPNGRSAISGLRPLADFMAILGTQAPISMCWMRTAKCFWAAVRSCLSPFPQ